MNNQTIAFHCGGENPEGCKVDTGAINVIIIDCDTTLDKIVTAESCFAVMISIFNKTLLVALVVGISTIEGFQQPHVISTQRVGATRLAFFGNNQKDEEPEDEPQDKGFMGDLKGMMSNFDAVVDDFVFKRMGNGEQFYGKRKYNPSGNIEGDYNGMGQSDLMRIEIARVRKEEMELLRQRRLEEQEANGAGKGPKKWG